MYAIQAFCLYLEHPGSRQKLGTKVQEKIKTIYNENFHAFITKQPDLIKRIYWNFLGTVSKDQSPEYLSTNGQIIL